MIVKFINLKISSRYKRDNEGQVLRDYVDKGMLFSPAHDVNVR